MESILLPTPLLFLPENIEELGLCRIPIALVKEDNRISCTLIKHKTTPAILER